MFLIHINDVLYGICYTAKPVICADNTSVLITARNINELQIEAKTYTRLHEKIVFVNGLTLNIDKTNIVQFSSKHYQDEKFLINYQKIQ